MHKAIAILFALGSVFFTNAKALTIINADAFAPGDGKAIYDTTSGLTWLDFGINNGIFFNDVVDQLGSGKYSEWRLPTESEVLQLFNRAWSHETTEPYVSTFLVRDTPSTEVSEPTPGLLLFFGLAAMIFRRARV
jgi:hypothetical protein